MDQAPLAAAACKLVAMTLDVSVVVVSFNTRGLTLACLRSVFEQTRDLHFEVLVVDNASSDGSADAIESEFPDVTLIRQSRNLGFAAANNIAAVQARGEYLLLLNSDTIVLDSAIQKLVEFARQHPQAGIWGGRTLFADRSLNPTSCWRRPTIWSTFCRGAGLSSIFRRSRIFDPESYGRWKRNSVRRVDIVTGCFFLITRNLWRSLNGFDRAFFMYAEEADLCLRARRLGYRPMITPDATIIHLGGASEPVRSDKLVKLFRAKVQLFDRHWSRPAARFGSAMMWLWAASRAAAWSIIARPGNPRHAASREAWIQVWRRREEWLGGDRAATHLSLSELAETS